MPKLPKINSYYGWRADIPDHRDHCLTVPKVKIPDAVDLSVAMPPCWNQGEIGSCTAHAIAGAIVYDQIKQGLPAVVPSRLFIYYSERSIEGTIGEDAGAEIRDGVKSVNQVGAPPETLWTYSDKSNKFKRKPPVAAFKEALNHTAVEYKRVPRTLTAFQGCIASGFPIVFGFSVPESFEGDQITKDGILHMPAQGEKIVGGHAVLAMGYDKARDGFKIRNSWDTDWGLNGYFWMPFGYFIDGNLTDDFWRVNLVT